MNIDNWVAFLILSYCAFPALASNEGISTYCLIDNKWGANNSQKASITCTTITSYMITSLYIIPRAHMQIRNSSIPSDPNVKVHQMSNQDED